MPALIKEFHEAFQFELALEPLTQASIPRQPTQPVSLSKPSPTCGILPKKCHVALSPLHMQTVPLRRATLAHSTRGRILSGRRSTFSGYLTSKILSADVPPSPDISHPKFCRPTFHLLRISHIQNSVRSTFHLLRIFHIRRLKPDGREGRFNFPGQTCPDPLIALTRRASATDNSDSPDSLAPQTLVIRRIHFHPQSKGKLR